MSPLRKGSPSPKPPVKNEPDPVYGIRDGRPQMRVSVVLLMDLLGYQQMTADAKTPAAQEELLARLHGALMRHRREVEPEQFFGAPIYEVRAFTDNIVIGWPIAEDGEHETGNTFLKVASYQFALAREGFFTRGGLAVGPHFMDEYAVFGPALVEAYKIESQRAVYPRIVLSADARTLVKHHVGYYADPVIAPHDHEILIDADGEWFLNYLDGARLDDDEANLPHYRPLMIQHRDRVVENLERYATDRRILDKYVWVGKYHNYVCSYLYPEDGGVTVPAKYLGQPFTRLAEKLGSGRLRPKRRAPRKASSTR